MSLEALFESYNLYIQLALAIDLCTICINICVLIVLFSQRKNVNITTKKHFLFYIATILMLLTVEMISWLTVFKEEYYGLYRVVVTLDYILIWILPVAMFMLVANIIADRGKFSKTFNTIYYSLYLILGALLLIPSFREQVIVFNDELYGYVEGPFLNGYYIIESVLLLFGVALGFVNAKKIGIKDTIVISLFILAPLTAVFINTWWASTVGMLLLGLFLIILVGITYQTRLVTAREQDKVKQIELHDVKSKLLLTQIQPHFLYNTLTTLKYLCETNPEKASNLCDDFSNYLRSNIDAASDSGLVPFDKELENIENYLHIEQARFGNRVNYQFDIKTRDFLVPVLAIQTIVENAVKKGICGKVKGGTITVSTLDIGNDIEIKVVDDGVGFDVDTYLSDGKMHVGLLNTKYRLEMIGGSVKVESEVGKGTTVTVLIPKEEDL